ncbi:MAG: hypothetical protein KGH94_01925 [Candidatus Micrarchaeota archaeon]|nr:hypothetical protein [Candidatus Micrarchaeota archaeon]
MTFTRQTPALPEIRSRLGRCEAGIVLAFSERAEHPSNSRMYLRGELGGIEMLTSGQSFSESYMTDREVLDRIYGRFRDNRQHPFFPHVANQRLAYLREATKDPVPRGANKNAEIRRAYFKALKLLCREGDDGQYGESATADLDCLERLSFRVHYGDVVAERKLQDNPDLFRPLILADDWQGVKSALRDTNVEAAVIDRVSKKCLMYGVPDNVSRVIVDFYADTVIPVTVAVEVEYLKRRKLDKTA